jgi:hypothetical protein
MQNLAVGQTRFRDVGLVLWPLALEYPSQRRSAGK